MPTIVTTGEPAKKRFKKESADIAAWAQAATNEISTGEVRQMIKQRLYDISRDSDLEESDTLEVIRSIESMTDHEVLEWYAMYKETL